ncbi:MAG TPA: RNA polymerase subunit sigma-70, partial [Mycobacterium sp.]|nr:RNA polymerase subunit sigma-70 [Mycobacterium sp.]
RARAALRDSNPIRIPSNLLGLLSEIPHYPSDDDDTTSEASDRFPARDERKRR